MISNLEFVDVEPMCNNDSGLFLMQNEAMKKFDIKPVLGQQPLQSTFDSNRESKRRRYKSRWDSPSMETKTQVRDLN